MMLSVTDSGRRILKAYSLDPFRVDPATNSATVNVSEKMVFDWSVGARELLFTAAA